MDANRNYPVSELKRLVRERDGMKCTRCGTTNAAHLENHGKSLHVHRLEPGGFYAFDRCVTLCYGCHGPEPRSPHGSAKLNMTVSQTFSELAERVRVTLEAKNGPRR